MSDLFAALQINLKPYLGQDLDVVSPIDGTRLTQLKTDPASVVDGAVARARLAFQTWRSVPAPVRGELIRLFGVELRAAKSELGGLVTREVGKIKAEGLGEVQEMIDICDFATGLSRQLYGLTIASERPGHHMRETWHPLGPIGVISAFNFPVAVWAWNAALAIVCGNPVIWKPSEKAPLSAIAAHEIFARAVTRARAQGLNIPDHLCQIIIGKADVGAALASHPNVPLISATGSTTMGRKVASQVGLRRHLLELGGNAGMIVTPSANRALALRAILFGAVGTAGQRCTTLRRLIVHESLVDEFLPQLKNAYQSLRIGDPRLDGVLVGPLIDERAVTDMERALIDAMAQGGQVICGGEVATAGDIPKGGYYVRPTIVQMPSQTEIVKHETFAPILYVMTYRDFSEAVAMHNDVPQGLSSCVFTQDVNEAEAFLSSTGSDCGIANVNIGPSGAEIGGAFGGEKETGGGRESGSDAWKYYMRRQTQTVNYSGALPLAQGVVFGD